MTGARLLENGDLLFPARGNPPNDNIPGYSRDPQDPYLFRLQIDNCKHREMKTTLRPCGKVRAVMWCSALSEETNALKCDSCLIL